MSKLLKQVFLVQVFKLLFTCFITGSSKSYYLCFQRFTIFFHFVISIQNDFIGVKSFMSCNILVVQAILQGKLIKKMRGMQKQIEMSDCEILKHSILCLHDFQD